MTYDEALAFWYGRINYEVRAAQPGDLKLERMRALLRLLGDPHDRLRLVHVTGTKGKGSTCAMLAAIMRAAGYRVGLFTSPHLADVRERIQVDGDPISPAELVARMEEIAPAVRELETAAAGAAALPGPTFFEIGTALGFLHFCYRRCDIAVIEVGLGGRFDSTNVCLPLVCVITNVGFDHMAQLGNTLEEIAYQKAGIIKRRVPVVSGVTQAGPREVIRRVAEAVDAPLSPPVAIGGLSLALPGEHQQQNAAVALAAIQLLDDTGMSLPATAVERGLRNVYWPARIERLSQQPTIILDTAHNVPSVEALVATLRQSFPVAGRKTVVFAVSFDKQYPEMLRILTGYFDHFHLTKYGTNPRCVPPEKLAEELVAIAPGASFSLHLTSMEAWVAARAAAGAEDLVCITGSVFLAGELRPQLLLKR
jgi:dihydrofolate synthase / folylpolyglutamate synthase